MEETKDVIAEFKKKFENERNEWKEKVKTLAGKLYNISNVAEAQIDLLSNRQIIIEYNHELLSTLSSLNKMYRKKKRDKFEAYGTDYDLKLQKAEKDIMVEGDLADLKERIEILSNQIKFYDQTIQTVDHALYGIKSRIQLEEFRRK